MRRKLKSSLAHSILSGRLRSEFFDLWAIDSISRMEREELLHYQMRRIRDILSYAYERVSYWKAVMDALHIKPKDIQTVEDFDRFPVMARDIFYYDKYTYYADGWEKMKYFQASTSGSTGRPITIFTSTNSPEIRLNTNKHFLYVCGLSNLARFTPFFWTIQNFRRLGTAIDFFAYRNDLGRLCQILREKGYRAIGGPPSILILLADYIKEKRLSLSLKFVQSGAEYLSPATRRDLEESFQCPVYDRYGCTELGTIAHECRMQIGAHVSVSNMLVQIVDESGKSISGRASGRIVITSFDNIFMPLIRYKIGDIGYWIDSECECGLRTPRIFFEGRSLHFLELPDGRKYPVLEIVGFMSRWYGGYMKRLQIIQESHHSIRLCFVPTHLYDERWDGLITRSLMELMDCDGELTIHIEKKAALLEMQSGKIPVFISLLNK